MHNFTTDDLLAHIYNDEPLCIHPDSLSSSIKQSWALQQKLNVLQESVQILNDIPLHQPQPRTIEAVLQYADLAIHVS